MQKLLDHINRRKKKISALLSVPAEQFRPETFHRLRVELKKTDAFFRLAEYAGRFNRKKKYAPLKLLFTAAGEVREIQVLESFLHDRYPEHQHLKNLRSRLFRLKKEKRAAFFLLRESIPPKKTDQCFRSVGKALNDISMKAVHDFLDYNYKEIRALLQSGQPDASDLHRIRKLLKTNTYLTKPLQRSKQELAALPVTIKLAERLGRWHDLDVMAGRIAELSKQKAYLPDEREFLRCLSGNLQKKAGFSRRYWP